MTGAQASYLKTLSEQTHEPEAFDDALTKAEASKRTYALKERVKLPRGWRSEPIWLDVQYKLLHENSGPRTFAAILSTDEEVLSSPGECVALIKPTAR